MWVIKEHTHTHTHPHRHTLVIAGDFDDQSGPSEWTLSSCLSVRVGLHGDGSHMSVDCDVFEACGDESLHENSGAASQAESTELIKRMVKDPLHPDSWSAEHIDNCGRRTACQQGNQNTLCQLKLTCKRDLEL